MTFDRKSGPKPAKKYIREASKLVRPGTATHMAVAMAMRPSGTTQGEVVAVLGKPHRNIIKRLIDLNQVKIYELPEGSRYHRIRLVKKG